jgi:hypothetical protein
LCAGGEPRIGLTTLFVHVQIGDGTTTNRYSPVSVVGLSSGVAMVALGACPPRSVPATRRQPHHVRSSNHSLHRTAISFSSHSSPHLFCVAHQLLLLTYHTPPATPPTGQCSQRNGPACPPPPSSLQYTCPQTTRTAIGTRGLKYLVLLGRAVLVCVASVCHSPTGPDGNISFPLPYYRQDVQLRILSSISDDRAIASSNTITASVDERVQHVRLSIGPHPNSMLLTYTTRANSVLKLQR